MLEGEAIVTMPAFDHVTVHLANTCTADGPSRIFGIILWTNDAGMLSTVEVVSCATGNIVDSYLIFVDALMFVGTA